MSVPLFQKLRSELKRDYGITKKSILFIPFEDWRFKLKDYQKDFQDEYGSNLNILRNHFNLQNLLNLENTKNKLILFAGISGAGKTTLAEAIRKKLPNTILVRGHDVVNILNLFGKEEKKYRQRLRKRGFKTPDPWYISYLYQESLTRELLNKGYNVIFDDHIRTRKNRQGYYGLAKSIGAKIVFIKVYTPLKVAFERRKNEADLNFLANFVFQSQDFSEEEKKKYDKLIDVNGTAKLSGIEKKVISKIKSI
ncbi:hypothetical protein COU59_00440 [Candidatus Pacearchaeota archaeon CG10_big_fil_rev_8_21_14_0_10_34_12]|nr:MAG: hypothetical protein COU59_00440 [Candidatus Pacearchaeota archaeon CG10_big_fil_rev_8_21_14_0_10_34_12]